MLNINLKTLKHINYNGNDIDCIVHSDDYETNYNNIKWRSDSKLNNLYYLEPAYLNPIDQYYSSQNNSIYGFPEYMSHNLFIPELNGYGYKGILSANYSDISTNWEYILGTQFINCNDEAYCLALTHWGGSSGCGQKKLGKLDYELNEDSKDFDFFDIWYRTGAAYQIDGAYSSKIIHLPADSGTISIDFNKYGTKETAIMEPWHDVCKEYYCSYDDASRQNGNAIKYRDYYYAILSSGNCWYSTDVDIEQINNTKKTTSISAFRKNNKDLFGFKQNLLRTDKIILSATTDNQYHVYTVNFNYGANTEKRMRWQLLSFTHSNNSKYQGYLPDLEDSIMNEELYPSWVSGSRGDSLGATKMIFVQDIKDDPFIYYGSDLISDKSPYGQIGYFHFSHRPILDENGELTGLYYFDFSHLSFSTLNKLKKYHPDYLVYQGDLNKGADFNFIGLFPIVAIPEIYYNQGLRPQFYDLSNNLMTWKDRYTNTTSPSTYTYNGVTYKVFCPDIVSQNAAKCGYRSQVCDSLNLSSTNYWAKITLNLNEL